MPGYDYEGPDDDDYDEEDELFDSPGDKEAPELPVLQLDISQEAIRHELSKRLSMLLDGRTLRKMAEEQVRKILDEEMNAWLRRSIGKTVTGLVEEYFTKSRELTNQWGEKTGGDPQALGDEVVKRTENFLNQATSSHSRSGSRLNAMVQEILMDPVEQHVKDLLKKIREEKESEVTAMIAKMMADSFKQIGG